MRLSKYLLTVVLTLNLFGGLINAQSTKRLWLLGAGLNIIDFNAPYNFGDLSKTLNWNLAPAFSKLTIAGSLNRSFALGVQVGGARITTVNNGNEIGARGFVDGDVDLRYKFDNGYIIKEDAAIAPYLFAGGGANIMSDDTLRANVGGGLGLNLWLWKDFGIYLQSAYRLVPGNEERVTGNQSYFNHSAGLVLRFGESDSDNDGVEDDDDACPDLAGPTTTMGCPDRDNDGVADKLDACADQAGPAALNGCPDADADGIADKDDTCPNEQGTKEMRGCPDRDSDGVTDKEDQCPDQKGVVQMSGCPDTDGDGISDKTDACPTQKGTTQYQGCPDSDNDGVPDNKDKCQGVPGPGSNAGCPVPKKEEIQKINLSAKSIQFQTGKDVITKQSFAVLDVIAEIMTQYPQTYWQIDGHTDNVGDSAKNHDLSHRRADAVKKYFENKAIDSDRLNSAGYGEASPIANNKTSAGRAQNRRVEIKLLTQE
jgi:outer membrane protein OmpA-like peptidoglycan-associated protein